MDHPNSSSSSALPPHYEEEALFSTPDYTCNISLTNNFLCKRELENPQCLAKGRTWHRVQAELRGTVLIIRTQSTHTSAQHERGYTLQAADAGLATDYKRRSHVLRIRAEGQQFLLAAADLATVVDWIEKLNAAIAVSLPLEDRWEPGQRILPRNPFSSSSSAGPPMDRFWCAMRETWFQSRRQRTWLSQIYPYPEAQQRFPALSVESATGHDYHARSPKLSMHVGYTERHLPSVLCPCALCWAPGVGPRPWVTLISRPETERLWRLGQFESTLEAQLDDARRCSRVLTYLSPWKDKWYVKDGRTIKIGELAARRAVARADWVSSYCSTW